MKYICCKIKGCSRKYTALGLCSMHYARFREHGDANTVFVDRQHNNKCGVDDCNKDFYSKKMCRYHYEQSKICNVDGCKKHGFAMNMCGMHYRRFKVHGDVNKTMRDPNKTCSVVDCDKKHHCKDYCRNHYQQFIYNKQRNELMMLLGGVKCNICGFNDIMALQIDHVDGNGKIYRSKFSRSSELSYYLKNKNESREKLQVLCANCNYIKRYTNNEVKIGLFASNIHQ